MAGEGLRVGWEARSAAGPGMGFTCPRLSREPWMGRGVHERAGKKEFEGGQTLEDAHEGL